MDLTSMLEREDFFSLFFTTVEKYYRKALNQKIELSLAETRRETNMVIKPFLSAATTTRMTPAARKFFYSEWNIRGSFLKNIAAKLYVFFLTRSGKCFAQYRLKMLPENMVDSNIVIAPNNRSIRIFNYGDGTVGCIIKDGFTDKFFKKQLEFRKKYHYDFLLPMLDFGDDWFREPILEGHPLARVTDEQLYCKGIKESLSAINTLADETRRDIDFSEYVAKLVESIHEMLKKAVLLKNIKSFEETCRVINKISESFQNVQMIVPVCVGHGDLQTGNIWIDKNEKVWIYDWETAGERSVWYDAAVLQYSLRRHSGWADLFKCQKPEQMLYCDKNKQYSIEEFSVIKKIVLLEDLVFYLEDMLELPENWGAELYDAFIQRIIQTGEFSE